MKRLFVSIVEGFEREIRPATIHHSAGLIADKHVPRPPASVTAHEVRALATSWAAYKGVALGDVLEAAT
jgi:hypothetical protein